MSSPVFGTKEWAKENVNCAKGCPHGCHYCYAHANAVRFDRLNGHSWTTQSVYWSSVERVERMSPTRVMFPTQHDITPDILDESMETIARMLRAGHDILIVTKPHRECIDAICTKFTAFRPKILFRFTIGSTKDETLKLWEPNAPSFGERAWCLRWTYGHGYATSISSEPILDDTSRDLVQKLAGYVTDAIWFGVPNMLSQRLTLNNAPSEVCEAGRRLMTDVLTNKYIQELYLEYAGCPKVKWKESIKKIVGIEVPTEAGLDI